jgi:hypothetical protein
LGWGATVVSVSTADGRINPLSLNQGARSIKFPQEPAFDSYNTGYNTEPPSTLAFTVRGFFIFDLTSIPLPVTSARLRILQGITDSQDPIETVGFYEVTTPAAVLAAKNSIDPAPFADLGDGVLYATKDIVVGAPTTTVLNIDLNAQGVAAVNAARGGYFSVGVTLLTRSTQTDRNEYVFSRGPSGIVNYLDLTLVPEPSTALLAMSAAGVFLKRTSVRRRCNR